jgi:type VI secretion system protein ImpE
MLAHENLREGRLEEALAELQAQVRREPADPRHRVFLFQLLAVMGRWERALAQLEAAGELDRGAMPMVVTYRQALAAESARAEVFAGRASPALIGEPAEWMAWIVEALRLTAAGEHGAAADLRGRALEAAPATAGELDGTTFEWIADADSRLGPLLEVVLNGRYAWLPFQRLRALRTEPPSDLRDLVWMPAFLTLETGAELAALVPSRYPGAENEEDALRLCRRTNWRDLGEGTCWAGAGQRMLATDAGEHPLLDVRAVRLGGEAGKLGLEPARDGPHG